MDNPLAPSSSLRPHLHPALCGSTAGVLAALPSPDSEPTWWLPALGWQSQPRAPGGAWARPRSATWRTLLTAGAAGGAARVRGGGIGRGISLRALGWATGAQQ